MKKLLTALFILGGLLFACGKEGNQITQAEGVKKIEADGAMAFDFHHEQGEARTADIWIETYESGQTVDEPIASMLTFAETAEVQSMQVLMNYGKHGLRKNEITLVTPTEELETVDELDSLEGVTFKGQHSIYLSYENLAPNKEVIIGVMTFEASEQSTVKEQLDALLTDDLDSVPDMYGWTKENVDKFAEWTGIEITYKGDGSRVSKQNVKVETALKKTKKITITLGD